MIGLGGAPSVFIRSSVVLILPPLGASNPTKKYVSGLENERLETEIERIQCVCV